MTRYDAVQAPLDYSNADIDLDAHYARIDAGKACPVCWQRIQALRTQALGVPLFRCPHCSAEWINVTEQLDELSERATNARAALVRATR